MAEPPTVYKLSAIQASCCNFAPDQYFSIMQLSDLYLKASNFEFLSVEEGVQLYHEAP